MNKPKEMMIDMCAAISLAETKWLWIIYCMQIFSISQWKVVLETCNRNYLGWVLEGNYYPEPSEIPGLDFLTFAYSLQFYCCFCNNNNNKKKVGRQKVGEIFHSFGVKSGINLPKSVLDLK